MIKMKEIQKVKKNENLQQRKNENGVKKFFKCNIGRNLVKKKLFLNQMNKNKEIQK